ncbi:efflux RND transporter periplasmic adaptor subunit [Ketobacter sp.]|uniref:efflux RND transporter periplasmic adaptor subunit n=1 Tax=Ketobacter sp. TaxID=2083498 RepID=UPI000C4946C8|nr:efflux RND transporter periplasmic adaptor subunit [Ketobacter sp.]MAD27454.1 secretion protein HlyD [Pseudomonadales bacterium]RLT94530.1 MAG: HlyD family efflux transporter periplasmic adaptor subunit [Ketobacter sp.]|tara:strand:- start:1818 stop:2864 length:1047 start_codon:yes stop_codon:yes gene_type:complete
MNKLLNYLIGGLLLAAMASQSTIAAPSDQASHTEAGAQHTDEKQHSKEEHAEEDHAEDKGDHVEDTSHEGHEEEEPELTFNADLLREFGGEIATAEAGVIRQQVSLPGEVKLNEEAVAHITPRFPAKIVEVRAKTGDRVKADDILAVAESSETLSRFPLKSLIDGVVIKRHVTLGEHLAPDDTAFVVADLSTLWVDIALYPKQVPLVKTGQPVRVTTSHGPSPVETSLDYVAPLVDEATRTGLARVFLANTDNDWKPGMFVEGQITLGEFSAAVVVPRTAIIDLEGQSTIFVQHDGNWEPRPAKLGRGDSDSVEILTGLESGERYVAKGGFVLKAQLQKSEFESGHNH